MHRGCTGLRALPLAALALLLLAPPAHAQAIRAFVVEDTTDTPVAGVRVELLRPDSSVVRHTYSDSLGRFGFDARPGTYRLALTHPFHRALLSDTVSLMRDEIVRLQLRMGRTVIPLEPLVVVTRSRDPFDGFYERAERGGFGRYLTREQIELNGATCATNLLAQVSGVRIVYVPRAPGGSTTPLLMMRGGVRGCSPAIFIDGMRIGQYPDAGIDTWIQPQDLEGVEIYTSPAGIPPQFQSFGPCGVVAFWTRQDGRRPFSWKRLAAGVGAFAAILLLVR